MSLASALRLLCYITWMRFVVLHTFIRCAERAKYLVRRHISIQVGMQAARIEVGVWIISIVDLTYYHARACGCYCPDRDIGNRLSVMCLSLLENSSFSAVLVFLTTSSTCSSLGNSYAVRQFTWATLCCFAQHSMFSFKIGHAHTRTLLIRDVP